MSRPTGPALPAGMTLEAARRAPSLYSPTFTGYDRLPEGTRVEHLVGKAEDGASSNGILHTKGGERTVVMITHPRGDLMRHYMTPALLEAGYAVCGFMNRWPITDMDAVHEMIVLDMAGWVKAMRDRGFASVVLLGNSGGGCISALYQWQAEAAAGQRLTETAGGDPFDLNRYDIPAADGIIIMGAPDGEGALVLRSLDPSVTDEADPLSCDPDLDMYDSRNGYREPPEPSSYSPEFIERYRAAQLARSRRLDALARQRLAERRRFQARRDEPGFANLSLNERSYIERRAAGAPYLIINRTDASLTYCDLSLYPTKRPVGSVNSLNPQLANYSRGGFACVMTPRAWLSVWSGTSTNSSVLKGLPHVKAPTLIINYSGDRVIYTDDMRAMLEVSGSPDKEFHEVDADHYGLPLAGDYDPDPRVTTGRILQDWLQKRFRAR